MDLESSLGLVLGAGLAAYIIAFLVVALLLLVVLYVYTSFAWMTIGKKLKYKHSWLAWIPIANLAMILQLGGFHWAWVFLILIPFLGWLALGVMIIIAIWKTFERRKYPGWLALVPLAGIVPPISPFASLAFLVILGVVAWKDM